VIVIYIGFVQSQYVPGRQTQRTHCDAYVRKRMNPMGFGLSLEQGEYREEGDYSIQDGFIGRHRAF
jgi:hypothetical protein